MVELITGTILCFIAIAIFILGYLVQDHLFTYISSSLLLLIGLSMLLGGIQIQMGEIIGVSTLEYIEDNITYTTGNNTVIRQYENFDGIYAHAIGMSILWLAVYMGLVGWNFYKHRKEENN